MCSYVILLPCVLCVCVCVCVRARVCVFGECDFCSLLPQNSRIFKVNEEELTAVIHKLLNRQDPYASAELNRSTVSVLSCLMLHSAFCVFSSSVLCVCVRVRVCVHARMCVCVCMCACMGECIIFFVHA